MSLYEDELIFKCAALLEVWFHLHSFFAAVFTSGTTEEVMCGLYSIIHEAFCNWLYILYNYAVVAENRVSVRNYWALQV